MPSIAFCIVFSLVLLCLALTQAGWASTLAAVLSLILLVMAAFAYHEIRTKRKQGFWPSR